MVFSIKVLYLLQHIPVHDLKVSENMSVNIVIGNNNGFRGLERES